MNEFEYMLEKHANLSNAFNGLTTGKTDEQKQRMKDAKQERKQLNKQTDMEHMKNNNTVGAVTAGLYAGSKVNNNRKFNKTVGAADKKRLFKKRNLLGVAGAGVAGSVGSALLNSGKKREEKKENYNKTVGAAKLGEY